MIRRVLRRSLWLVGSFLIFATFMITQSPPSAAANTTSNPPTWPNSPASNASSPPFANIPHPVGLPAGPVASSADCPNPPKMSGPLPPGATISAPTLSPSNSSMDSGGTTVNVGGRCGYTLTWPGSGAGGDPSIYYNDWGNLYMPYGEVWASAGGNGYSGQVCYFNQYIVNSGGYAYSELELTGGYCNTDSSGIWSHTQVVTTSGVAGPVAAPPQFHEWAVSGYPGNVNYGFFEICLENPVGQQSDYWCNYGNFAPQF